MRDGRSANAGPGRLVRPRLYEQLADHIAGFIEAQGLSPGDRLPPERSLAAQLGVSRATLSRALVALEVQGRVEVRHGDGAVVRDPAAPAGGMFAGQPVDELVATREAVMAGIARRAAAHPDTSLRTALLAPDGNPRSVASVWRCLRRLVSPGLLTEMDDALASALEAAVGPGADATHQGPAARQAAERVAAAVLVGDGDAAAAACAGLLGPIGPR